MTTTTTSSSCGDAQKLQMMAERWRLETTRLRELLAAERNAVRALKASHAADIRRERTATRRREGELQAQLNSQRAQFEPVAKNQDCDECTKLRLSHEAELRRERSEFKRKEASYTSQLNELRNAKNLLLSEKSKSDCEQCAKYKANFESEMRKERSEFKKRETGLISQLSALQRVKNDSAKSNECEHCIKLSKELCKQKEITREFEEKIERLQETDRSKTNELRIQYDKHTVELIRVTRSCKQDTRRLLEELKTKDRIIEQLRKHVPSNKKSPLTDNGNMRKLREGDKKTEANPPQISTAVYDSKTDNIHFDKIPPIPATESKEPGGHSLNERLLAAEAEVNRLQKSLQNSEDVIQQLKQFNKEKDRRDQITAKQRREMFYRTSSNDLEPVVEEDTDSAVSSAPSSLSPQPYVVVGSGPCFPQYHGQSNSSIQDQERDINAETIPPTSLSPQPPLSDGYSSPPTSPQPPSLDLWGDKVEPENELTIAKRQVRELEKALLVTRGVKSDRHTQMVAALTEKVKFLEAREVNLLQELADLREQNELLEFRILELEECHDKWSLRSHTPPDTRDVWTDTESDSGVGSLCLDPEDAVRSRLLAITRNMQENEDKDCLLTVLALLDSLEALSREQALFCEEKVEPEVPLPTRPQHWSSLRERQPNRIVATVFPFTEYTQQQEEVSTPEFERNEEDLTGKIEDKKQLWNALCLQESGIFEGDPPEYNTQGTQTELVQDSPNNKPLDLTAEIQKLNQFRESIEVGNKTKKLLVASDQKFIREINFYKERLEVLERKLQIFESSGDSQTRQLAERLNREVYLASQVKDLSAKVQKLLADNSRLEEERCEFEEAENDTRLRCQQLEAEIESLTDRLKVMENSRCTAKRKAKDARSQATYWESMVNKYEERNYELEERECELRHKLEVMECTTPAILLFNMWKMMQSNPDADIKGLLEEKLKNVGKPRSRSRDCCDCKTNRSKSSSPQRGVSDKIRALESERDRLVNQKLNMENKVHDLEKELGELKTHSAWGGDQHSISSIKSNDIELIKNLQELTEREKDMKKRIQELEHREMAYMETLQQADDIWAEMETGYKKKISEAEESQQGLREKIRKMEKCDDRDDRVHDLEESERMLKVRVKELEKENSRLLSENKALKQELEECKCECADIINGVQTKYQGELEKEKRHSFCLEDQLRTTKMQAAEAGKEYDAEVGALKERLSKTKKELVHLEVTNSELKEEVETLESKISELGKELGISRKRDGDMIKSLSQELRDKDREFTALQHATAGGTAVSDEVSPGVMARRLGAAMAKVKKCLECADVDPCLLEAVQGIKSVCEVMECKGPSEGGEAPSVPVSSHPKDCDCPECVCAPCKNPKRARPADHPKDCDCPQCVCAPCTDPKVAAATHPKDCDCPQCVCAPCSDPKVAAAAHPKDCDCPQCVCAPCRDPKVAAASHPKDCDCPQCVCAPCRDPKVAAAAESKTHPKDCTCAQCACSPCSDPKMAGAHPKDCDCPQCTCDPCRDPKISAEHPKDCDCPQCTCAPCKDPKVGGTHPKDCDCPQCTCAPCSDPKLAAGAHPKDCDCPQCTCAPCRDPKMASGHPKGCECPQCACRPCKDTKAVGDVARKSEPHPEDCECLQCKCTPCTRVPKGQKAGGSQRPGDAGADDVCDCKPCDCAPCTKRRQQEMLKTGDGGADVCDCKPCECTPCTKMQPGEQKTDGGGTDICDCKPCDCAPCTKARQADGLKGRDSGAGVCDCSQCVCAPCTKIRKDQDGQTPGEGGTGVCDCNPCECAPCTKTRPEDQGGQQQEGGVCDCKPCECAPCTKARPGDSGSQQQGGDVCDCKPCECAPCTKARPGDQSGQQQGEGGVCDCTPCECAPCTKTRPGDQGGQQQQGDDVCDCKPCECAPCTKARQGDQGGKQQGEGGVGVCDCKPCECAPCTKIRQGGQSGQGGQQQGEGGAGVCDCKPCECAPCTKARQGDTQTSGDGGSDVCDCKPCKCSPCTKSRKEQDTQKSGDGGADVCDCKPCECAPCTKARGGQLQDGGGSQEGECDCNPCECNPCTKKRKGGDGKQPGDQTGEVCQCSPVCKCNPCNKFIPQTTTGHPDGCQCDMCTCDPCDPESLRVKTKTASTPGTGKTAPAASQTVGKDHHEDCTCPVCTCSPCARKGPTEGGDEKHPDECECDKCTCDPCSRPRKASDKHPETCDCFECKCKPCSKMPEKSGAAKHPDDCDCGDCRCDPCSRKPAAKHPDDCDCDLCQCDPCSRAGKSAEQAAKSTEKHPDGCDCGDCKCDPCSKMPAKSGGAKPFSETCDCDVCKCDPCSKKRKDEPAATQDQSDEMCDCPECKCEACKKKRVDVHPADCSCNQCTCDPCIDPSRGKGKGDTEIYVGVPCSCEVCKCNPCADPNRAKGGKAPSKGSVKSPVSHPGSQHGVSCDCDKCKCDPCSDPKRGAKQEVKQSTDVCDCPEPCPCDPCSKAKKEVHPDGCTCSECTCDPCSDPTKIKKPQEAHPDNCDCDLCKCDPCSKKKGAGPAKGDGHPDDCTCPACTCDPCSKMSPKPTTSTAAAPAPARAPAAASAGTKLRAHGDKCICSDCICDPCTDESIKPAAKAAPAAPAASPAGDHPDGCTCEQCTCDPCSKMPKPSPGDHPFDCTCAECTCEPCADPRVAGAKGAADHPPGCTCDTCTCDPCSKKLDPGLIGPSFVKESRVEVELKHGTGVCVTGGEEGTGEWWRQLDTEALKIKLREMEQEARERNREIAQIHKFMSDLQCRCDEQMHASVSSHPFIKAVPSKSFEATMSGLQVAVGFLQSKCRVKDHMIVAMTKELRTRADSGVFEDLLREVARPPPRGAPAPPDFDRQKICSTLPRPEDRISPEPAYTSMPCPPRPQPLGYGRQVMRTPAEKPCGQGPVVMMPPPMAVVCQCDQRPVDPTPMSVQELRRISSDSLLIKWVPPAACIIKGFEIDVNGVLKHRVHSANRTAAVLHHLNLSSKTIISVYAVDTSGARVQPPASAMFTPQLPAGACQL